VTAVQSKDVVVITIEYKHCMKCCEWVIRIEQHPSLRWFLTQ